MCRIFAGQDPAGYEYITRSVRLDGHSTSIRLEAVFWDLIDEIAASQEMTTPRFLSTLHDEVLEIRGEVQNFASLLRVCCVRYLGGPEAVMGSARAETAAPAKVAAVAN